MKVILFCGVEMMELICGGWGHLGLGFRVSKQRVAGNIEARFAPALPDPGAEVLKISRNSQHLLEKVHRTYIVEMGHTWDVPS